MKTFFISSENEVRKFFGEQGEGAKEKYALDFTQWADVNGAVTSVVWTVDSGNGAVSGEALASSVASAFLTTSDAGRTVMKVVATVSGGSIHTVYVDVLCRAQEAVDDYGFVS